MRRFIARRALNRLNEIRYDNGLGPLDVLPVGQRSKADSCVLAKGLPGGLVGRGGIEVNGRYYRHTPWTHLFITLFDFGVCYRAFRVSRAGQLGARRKLCETRKQAKARVAQEIIGREVREAEENNHFLQIRLESLEDILNERNADLEAERMISKRLEERLAKVQSEH